MYAFAGSLLFVQPSVLNVVVGLYMVFVGFIAFRVAKRATERLNEIHTGVQTEDELRAKFDEHKTTEGTLRKPEFAAFCVDLGVLVTYQELVDCFTTMDKNDDEEVTFEEISGWWSSWGSHNLPALSAEEREKLVAARPRTFAEAGAISGLTPASLVYLYQHVSSRGKQRVVN